VNVLAIDQGTSSTKALVVADEGSILAQAEVEVHPRATTEGGVEVDPEELLGSVVEAGRRALDEAGVRVRAAGLANQGETVLAWDLASGRPLSAAVVWEDRRAIEITDELQESAAELEQLSGLKLDPYFAAPKMTWLRRHVTGSGVVSTSDAWLLQRLTGEYVTDAATASRTMLLDLDSVEWSQAAGRAFGLDPAAQPRIVANAGIVGETSAFGDPIPVAGLAVDQQAALFAEGCHSPGEAKCTYGTGAFLLTTVGPEPRRSGSGLVGCVAWRLGEATTYCLDGQVYTAGSAVTWLQEVGLIAGPQELDTAGGAVASPQGAVFVPGLAGLAAPFWRPSAHGAFVGLSLGTRREHLVRAVVEGIAAEVAWLARAAGEDMGRPLARLRADGGLTRSTTLMQTQADLLQAPVEVFPSPNATALGVGALARLGVGAAASPEEALGDWRPAAVFEPRVSAAEAEERLLRWRQAAEATMELHG
jgi:glycerol kinase